MSEADILFETEHRSGRITLNRPRALNALSADMVAPMDAHYRAWTADPDVYGVILQSSRAGVFCSGGDLKELFKLLRAGDRAKAVAYYRNEYTHNWGLDRFTKPHVALIDGAVMGGGVGISLYGTHRVGADNFVFAMPETGIGFFPDIGASHFLSRMPGRTGLYLALTGRTIGLADAYGLGLLTHCIAARHFDRIRKAMSNADPVDSVLDPLHEDPGRSEIVQWREVIDAAFSGDTVEDILVSLDGMTGETEAWARLTASKIRQKCPLSLKVAHRQYVEGAALSLKQALEMEFRLACRFVEGETFQEGIRALLVDKDNDPDWRPDTIEDVTDAMINAVFAETASASLVLPDNPYHATDVSDAA